MRSQLSSARHLALLMTTVEEIPCPEVLTGHCGGVAPRPLRNGMSFGQPSKREASTARSRSATPLMPTRWKLNRCSAHESSPSFETGSRETHRRPKSSRIGFNARPTPEGCERVPSVELVQRVLQEVFGVDDLPSPTEEAVYVVDLLQPESAGRYQLFGLATSRPEDRTRVLRGTLEALLRRTSADFPIEVGHRLRVRSLSNGKVVVSFPQRRDQVGSDVLDALPDLWTTAVEDLRNRLSV